MTILALQIIGWWILLSCTLAPAITWWIFRNKRHARELRARWRANHPTTPWELMPAHIADEPKLAPAFSREFIQ